MYDFFAQKNHIFTLSFSTLKEDSILKFLQLIRYFIYLIADYWLGKSPKSHVTYLTNLKISCWDRPRDVRQGMVDLYLSKDKL